VPVVRLFGGEQLLRDIEDGRDNRGGVRDMPKGREKVYGSGTVRQSFWACATSLSISDGCA
jgi:hypothetical protein